MKIQLIVKHQPADEWVKREPQPADEMCKKHNPLVGLWSRDDLSLGRESVGDLLGQISGLPELLDVLLDGRGHPLTSSSRSGHLWSIFSNKREAKAWALELKDGKAEEEKGCGWKKGVLTPL